MNIASLISISRIILIFPIIYLSYLENYYANFFAFFLFILAGLTDFFDGFIARKTNTETKLGALLDLLADKLLVCTLLIWLATIYDILSITLPVIIIISRELIISSLRQFSFEQNQNSLRVSMMGKSKTTLQIISIAALIITLNFQGFLLLLSILILWIATLLSILSLFDYLRSAYKEFY